MVFDKVVRDRQHGENEERDRRTIQYRKDRLAMQVCLADILTEILEIMKKEDDCETCQETKENARLRQAARRAKIRATDGVEVDGYVTEERGYVPMKGNT